MRLGGNARGVLECSFHAGQDFRSLVTPLVKHVRLHLIDPQDIMKVPSTATQQ